MKPNVVIVNTSQLLTGGTALTMSSAGRLQAGSYYYLRSVEVHVSENITETFSVTRDSILGANYDTELHSSAISAADDKTYTPEKDAHIIPPGDNVVVGVTAATTTGTAYAQMYLEEIVR